MTLRGDETGGVYATKVEGAPKKSNEKGEKSRKATKVKLKERGKAEVGDAPKGKEPKVMRKRKERNEQFKYFTKMLRSCQT